jgi:phosphoribosyl-ATP pyrophosphohydrolase
MTDPVEVGNGPRSRYASLPCDEFHQEEISAMSILNALEGVIAERKANPPAGKPSYVVKLMNGGVPAIGAKVIEEAAEVVEAADEPQADQLHLIKEVADLFFHTLVLLGQKGVAFGEVEAELGRRFGIGGIEEKAARSVSAGSGEG